MVSLELGAQVNATGARGSCERSADCCVSDVFAVQAAWSPTGTDSIKTIAICAGSGESVVTGTQADLYLTGEMGHHYILAAQAKGTHTIVCQSRANAGRFAVVVSCTGTSADTPPQFSVQATTLRPNGRGSSSSRPVYRRPSTRLLARRARTRWSSARRTRSRSRLSRYLTDCV